MVLSFENQNETFDDFKDASWRLSREQAIGRPINEHLIAAY